MSTPIPDIQIWKQVGLLSLGKKVSKQNLALLLPSVTCSASGSRPTASRTMDSGQRHGQANDNEFAMNMLTPRNVNKKEVKGTLQERELIRAAEKEATDLIKEVDLAPMPPIWRFEKKKGKTYDISDDDEYLKVDTRSARRRQQQQPVDVDAFIIGFLTNKPTGYQIARTIKSTALEVYTRDPSVPLEEIRKVVSDVLDDGAKEIEFWKTLDSELYEIWKPTSAGLQKWSKTDYEHNFQMVTTCNVCGSNDMISFCSHMLKKFGKPVIDLLRMRKSIVILRKDPLLRTKEDTEHLIGMVKKFRSFQKFRLAELAEVMKIARYQFADKKESVIVDDRSWFVVFDGHVYITTESGRFIQTQELRAGNTLVEFDRVKLPQNSEVFISEPTHFIRFIKTEYDAVMKTLSARDFFDATFFVKHIPLLQSWSTAAIDEIGRHMTWKTFEAGEEILKQGEPVDMLYFIKSGDCIVYRSVMVEGQQRKVQIAQLGPRDYCGEQILFPHAFGKYHGSIVTIETASSVVFGTVSMEARNPMFWLKHSLTPAEYLKWSDKVVASKFLEQKKFERQDKVKKRLIKELSVVSM